LEKKAVSFHRLDDFSKSNKQKFLLASWRSLMKIAGSWYASGSGPKFHGSATLVVTICNFQ
jgi:hypothetical protein